MMHMTFYWGRKVTVLFDFWKTQNWLDYGLTLLACLLFSAFYQYLEHRRLLLNNLTTPSPDYPSSTAPLLTHQAPPKKLTSPRFAAALLFGINSAIGYMLMLAVMSFNAGVFLAVVFGLSLGYLFFRSSSNHAPLLVDNPCACA